MPFLSELQAAFGEHDIAQVQAFTDSAAQQGAKALGARAFATGNQVAFGEKPDLHTAAHEAAHVIQQRSGIDMPDGLGAIGHPLEQHADAVADQVVQGGSAEALLARFRGGSAGSTSIQRVPAEGTDLGTWSDNTTDELTAEEPINGDAGQAFPNAFETRAEAEAYASVWLAQRDEDGAAVIRTGPGFRLVAIDDGSVIYDFEGSNLRDSDVVRSTHPDVVSFVTEDGLVVPLGQRMTNSTNGPTTIDSAGFAALSESNVNGDLDMSEAELATLFEKTVQSRALETLDANAAFIRDTVAARYSGSEQNANVDVLRQKLVEFDGFLTPCAALFGELTRIGLDQYRLNIRMRDTEEPMMFMREQMFISERQTQTWEALLAISAAMGTLLVAYPELERAMDKSNAPNVNPMFGVESPTEDSYQSRIAGLSDEAAAAFLVGEINGVMENIGEAREMLLNGDISPLDLDQLANTVLGELDNPSLATAGRIAIADHASGRSTRNLIIGAVNIALFVGGLFASGGLSMALLAGASATGIGGAAVSLEEAFDQVTVAGTHLDPSQALASDRAASNMMFWAAVEGAFAVIDGLALARSLSEVIAARRMVGAQAQRARAAAEVADPVAHALANSADARALVAAHPQFGRQALEDAGGNVDEARRLLIERTQAARLPDGTLIPPQRTGTVYHGTSDISPEVAFESGLPGGGGDVDLLTHVQGNPDSAFRGTTDMILSPDRQAGAGLWADEGGWVYKIDGVSGWDTNQLLEGRRSIAGGNGGFGGNPVHGELETAIPRHVPPERIQAAIPIRERRGQLFPGDPILNPNYVELP